jgi:ABC-type phosphate transport system permease subunit
VAPEPIGPRGGAGEPESGVWPYVGVGCMTAVVGFFGSAMIAVLIAKGVGAATGCTPDADTGAPCNWLTYAVRGGLLGLVIIPTIVLRRMRKVRTTPEHSE